jgi:TnpA family transposase
LTWSVYFPADPNRFDDQEPAVHALHLLQSCLIPINTLMLQRLRAEPVWMARMTPMDARCLTPLV